MSLFDGLVAVGVILGFMWIIFVKVAEKNPKVQQWVLNLKNKKDELPIPTPGDTSQQVWNEKRNMI